MSITTTSTKDSYTGNNSTSTPYPITFKYLEDSHITVYVDGVALSDSYYTLTGDGSLGTGQFTTALAYASTQKVVVVLDVPFNQPVDLLETGALSSSTLEEAYDRLNMQIRRVWRKVGGVLTFSSDEGGTGSTGTADTLVGFDGSGDLGEISNATFLQTANDLSDVDAATARTNLGVDVAGTDNSTDVTLAGTGTYVSIAGQVITADEITEGDLNTSINASLDLADSSIQTLASATGNLPVTNLNSGTAATSLTYWRGDGSWGTPSGAGDMATSVYDPTAVTGDAFNMDNMVEGATTKILTLTERTNLGTAMQSATYDPTTVAGDAFDSANHAYTPAGTGAVTTDVETKLSERISVKDFGAVGDGVTDDTTKIQAAIDYAYSLGGGNVHLPVGRYMVSQIEVPQRVILQGETAGFGNQYTNNVVAPRGSVLFCISGTNADVVTITMRLETDGTETTLGYSNPDVRHFGGLRDLTVWGNRSVKAAPTGTNNELNNLGDAIKIAGARYVQLHNVVAALAADDGVSMGSFDYGTSSGSIPCNNMMWSNVTAISNFGNGFELYGGDHSFSQLQAGYNGASGIITSTGNSCFTGCYAWNNQVNGIYFLGSGQGTTTMTGCRAYDNESNGFLIAESGQLHLTGCQSKTNGREGGGGSFSDANRSNFHVTSLAQGVLLSGCQSVSESGQDYDEYGFYIDNTTYQVTLSGCRAASSGTKDYQISDYSKLRSCNDIGAAQPLHSGFVAEGGIDMAGFNVNVNAGSLQNTKSLSYNSWSTVSTVTTNTLACGSSTMIALNTASPETVNDITSAVGGIVVHTFRNAGSNDVTFTHNNNKLRNNSGADIVLSARQSISYAYVSGAVWQQI